MRHFEDVGNKDAMIAQYEEWNEEVAFSAVATSTRIPPSFQSVDRFMTNPACQFRHHHSNSVVLLHIPPPYS
jgi:hypothetical protein